MIKNSNQLEICKKYSSAYVEVNDNSIVGISKDFDLSNLPINGLRHPVENDSCGWYIWSGDKYSESDDFFVPLHVYHIKEKFPEIYKYLGLSPGFRFLFGDDGYVDVWEDSNLLNI